MFETEVSRWTTVPRTGHHVLSFSYFIDVSFWVRQRFLLRLYSGRLARRWFWGAWDVISVVQEGKKRRYLQKVSHMLNQWHGMGRTAVPSPPSDKHTLTARLTLGTFSPSWPRNLKQIIKCSDFSLFSTSLCVFIGNVGSAAKASNKYWWICRSENGSCTCGRNIWRAEQTGDQNQASVSTNKASLQR